MNSAARKKHKRSLLITCCIWFLAAVLAVAIVAEVSTRYSLLKNGVVGQAVVVRDIRKEEGGGTRKLSFSKMTDVMVLEPSQYSDKGFRQDKFMSLKNYVPGEVVPVVFVPGNQDETIGEIGTKAQVFRSSFTSLPVLVGFFVLAFYVAVRYQIKKNNQTS